MESARGLRWVLLGSKGPTFHQAEKLKLVSLCGCTDGFQSSVYSHTNLIVILHVYDFWGTVKAAPHECVIRTGQP